MLPHISQNRRSSHLFTINNSINTFCRFNFYHSFHYSKFLLRHDKYLFFYVDQSYSLKTKSTLRFAQSAFLNICLYQAVFFSSKTADLSFAFIKVLKDLLSHTLPSKTSRQNRRNRFAAVRLTASRSDWRLRQNAPHSFF